MELAVAAAIGGTLLSAGSQLQAGRLAAKEGAMAQESATMAAGQEQASAQRAALNTSRQTRLMLSSLVARGAASGGGLGGSDLTLAGDIAKEGEYRRLTDLFTGDTRAQDLMHQGALANWQGQQKKSASKIAALGTVLQGGSSLWSRYAGPSDNIGANDIAWDNDNIRWDDGGFTTIPSSGRYR